MKKSEALTLLGLADGASDEDVKKAHREKVIESHPDKFAQDPLRKEQAEERTKRINEARDVLISRKWDPEYGRAPFAYPPYRPPGQATPSANGGTGKKSPYGDPFAGWPFGQGQQAWVWTSWDEPNSSASDRPFNPFNPFGAGYAAPVKTPEELRAQAKKALVRESGFIGAKLACFAALALVGQMATGMFLYIAASCVWGLYKRLGGCLLPLFFPLALIGAPFVWLIAPRAGAVTVGMGVFFLIAVLFDIQNMRRLIQAYRASRR